MAESDLTGSTRRLPPGTAYDYFRGAIADMYVGCRPQQRDGHYDAEFGIYRLGDTRLAYLSAPGGTASRDRRSPPDDAMFVNFSRGDWTIDHLGTEWAVPGGSAFVIDNEQSFEVAFDPTRRMRLYSLRIPRTVLGPATKESVRRAAETVASSESGRHLATQMGLLATMIDTGAVRTATLMAPVVVDLVRALLRPAGRAAPTRLARLMEIARGGLTDPAFDLAELASRSRWSVRTVQSAFAAEGLTFGDWLTGQRLDLAHVMLSDPAWEHTSIARIAHAAGFIDTSHFFRAFRRRFATTPGTIRRRLVIPRTG